MKYHMSEPSQALFYTVAGFCEAFSIGASTVYKLFRSGDLVGVKIGRHTKISKAEAERWAATLPAFSGRNVASAG